MIGEQLGSLTPFREPHLWRGRPQKPVGPAAEGSEGAAVANAAQVGMAMRAVEERWGERSEPHETLLLCMSGVVPSSPRSHVDKRQD